MGAEIKGLQMKIGEKIKKVRKARKWSQAKLAEKIEVHVTHISRLETARYTPSLELLIKFASTFEVTTDYLLYEQIDNADSFNFKDKNFFNKMKLIEDLDEQDREIINGVIEAFLTKRQMWNVLNRQSEV